MSQRLVEHTIAMARAAKDGDWVRVADLAGDVHALAWSAAMARVGATAGALVLTLQDVESGLDNRESALDDLFAEVQHMTHPS